MNRIDSTFARLKGKGEKALIAYIMAGDPSLADTEALVMELEQSGADIIELGVPFPIRLRMGRSFNKRPIERFEAEPRSGKFSIP